MDDACLEKLCGLTIGCSVAAASVFDLGTTATILGGITGAEGLYFGLKANRKADFAHAIAVLKKEIVEQHRAFAAKRHGDAPWFSDDNLTGAIADFDEVMPLIEVSPLKLVQLSLSADALADHVLDQAKALKPDLYAHHSKSRNPASGPLLVSIVKQAYEQVRQEPAFHARYRSYFEESVLQGLTGLKAGQADILSLLMDMRRDKKSDEIAALQKEFDATRADLAGILSAILAQEIPADQVRAAMRSGIEALHRLREEKRSLSGLANEVPEISWALAEADRALESNVAVDLDKARQAIARAYEIYDRAEEKRELQAAENRYRLKMRQGDIAKAQLRFDEAAERYAEAAAKLKPAQLGLRVEALSLHAIALMEHGKIFPGLEHLRQAITAYDAVLDVVPRERMPVEWARTTANRAVTLLTLGERIGGNEGWTLVEQALAAYDGILEVFAKDTAPTDWAKAQSNRATVLAVLGKHDGSKESAGFLKQAVEACDAALEVYSRETMPVDWAQTQTNRAIVLMSLGERLAGEAGPNLSRQAVGGFDAALEVFTRKAAPADWARVQMNRAIALRDLGERMSGDAGMVFLRQAVEAYDAALEIRTRDIAPEDWGTAQVNKANALRLIGERTEGEAGLKALSEAYTAAYAAFDTYNQDTMPADWAMTQTSCANILAVIGMRIGGNDGTTLLRQAVDGYDAAFDVYTVDASPIDWAMTEMNRAIALSMLANMTGGKAGLALVRKAIAGYDRALAVFAAPNTEQYARKARINRAQAIELRDAIVAHMKKKVPNGKRK